MNTTTISFTLQQTTQSTKSKSDLCLLSQVTCLEGSLSSIVPRCLLYMADRVTRPSKVGYHFGMLTASTL